MMIRRFIIFAFLILPFFAEAQNAPVSALGNQSVYTNTTTVSVTVTNFSNIGGCLLEVHFDPSVALATGATANPAMGGSLVVNISNPGVIILSWFTWPGTSLPANSMAFQLNFTRSGFGTTALEWYDTGFTCAWNDGDGVELIDIPTADYYINGTLSFNDPDAPHTLLRQSDVCIGEQAEVPVRVTRFRNIGKVNLELRYEPSGLIYQGYSNVSGFPNLSVIFLTPGKLAVSGVTGSGGAGISLPDSSVLCLIHFQSTGNGSPLTWYDDGPSCQYTGPSPVWFVLNDSPLNQFYFDGHIHSISPPVPAGIITGPPGGVICDGDSGVVFSVDTIAGAEVYHWAFPDGFSIASGNGTSTVVVNTMPGASSGPVTVYGENGCGTGGVSPPFGVTLHAAPALTTQPVSPPPVISGSGTAQFMAGASGYLLSYQWQEFSNQWSDLNDGGVYSGSGTAQLTIHQPPLSMNGNRYRCKVSGFCPPAVVTDGEATLSVSPPVGISGIVEEEIGIVIYPNPVNSKTCIQVFIPEPMEIILHIYDLAGKEHYVDREGFWINGYYSTPLPAEKLVPGLYFLHVSGQSNGKFYRATKIFIKTDRIR